MSDVFDSMDTTLSARQMAEAWFARLMAPDCSQAEREAFERWRLRTPANAQAYAVTEGLWDRLEGLESDEVVGPHARAALRPEAMEEWAAAIEQRGPRPRHAPRARRWRWPLAVAASLLAVWLGWPGFSSLWETASPRYYASHAALETVTLEDGSRVQMDLATRIEVKLARSRREVRLLEGRAIFDVAHDRSRPFVVDAGPGSVTALGTRFQVDRLNGTGGVVVTLVEGAVAVSEPGAGLGGALRLQPGQQARYSPRQGVWTRYDADPAAATSWSQGFHVFSSTPLADAVREVNRYAPRKMRLDDAALGGLVISGNFKAGDADTIAMAMPAVLPVRAEVRGDEIVLSRR